MSADLDTELGIPSIEDTLKQIEAAAQRKSQAEEAIYGPEPTETKPAPVAPVPDVPVSVTSGQSDKTDNQGESVQDIRQTPMSGKLRQILAKEAALIERERKLKEMEAAREVPAAPAAPTLDQLRVLYKRNKIEALKALDPNFKPGATAKELWYHDLGDLAPKEARAELEAAHAVGSVEALKAELEETKQQLIAEMNQRQAEMAYQQYVGATQAYVREVPTDLPLVSKFATKKPEKVVQALIGVAQKHAQATGGREVLTPAQAAAKLEASLKELQFGDVPVSAPSTPPAETKPVAGGPNTLRNKHTSVQPTRSDDGDLDDEVLRQRALAAIEAAKRQRATRGY